jgi:hypothetical protein
MKIFSHGRRPLGHDLVKELGAFTGRVTDPLNEKRITMEQLVQFCKSAFREQKSFNPRSARAFAKDIEKYVGVVDYGVLTIALLGAGFEGKPGISYNSEHLTDWTFRIGWNYGASVLKEFRPVKNLLDGV